MGTPSLDRYIRHMLGEGTWAYKPLRAVLPRPLASWLTFLASGFVLHDIAHMDLSRAPFVVVRLAANLSYLGGCFVITRAFLP